MRNASHEPKVPSRRRSETPVRCQFDPVPEPVTAGASRAPRRRVTVKPTHPTAPGKYQALLPVTSVEARIDVGFGNCLYIRGEGDGLSWDQGQPLTCLESSRWAWNSDKASGPLVFKLLLNDRQWAQGPNGVVAAGESCEVTPLFA